MMNSRVLQAAGALTTMRSVEQGANPQVPVGHVIPNFPRTPGHISHLNGTLPFQCFPPFLGG
jgi:hypothetical protein